MPSDNKGRSQTHRVSPQLIPVQPRTGTWTLQTNTVLSRVISLPHSGSVGWYLCVVLLHLLETMERAEERPKNGMLSIFVANGHSSPWYRAAGHCAVPLT